MSEKKELVTTKTLFHDIDALYDPEYENNFERYKETCFESWNWLETREKRDEHVKMMKAKMNEHDCKVKKRCKKCAPIVTQLNKLQNAWSNGHYLLKFRYASSVPGLILGVKYIGKDNWIIKTAYQLNMDKKSIKRESYDVDTAFIVRTFGKPYANFVYNQWKAFNKNEKYAGFFNAPLKRTIPLNTKAIAKVKYIPPKLEYEYYYEEEEVFVKSGEPSNRKRISITSGLTYENARDNKCKNIKRVRQRRATGHVVKEKWAVLYDDNTTLHDITEKDLLKMYGKDYLKYVKHSNKHGYHAIISGAKQESRLYKWPSLVNVNAPKVEFIQDSDQDLCIPKAFASVLCHVGFTKEANCVNTEFSMRDKCYTTDDCNLKKIYQCGKRILPKWLQCNHKGFNRFNWKTDLDKYDIFVGVLEGSDGEVNHAIGIFNNWIFDSNENVAIPLCQEGLNYCVSNCETDVEFVKFKRGFFFRDRSDNTKKLKRKYG